MPQKFERAAMMSRVNRSLGHNRGARRFGQGVRREPRCWHPQRPRTMHIGTSYFRRAHL